MIHEFGWIDDPVSVEQISDTLPMPYFSQAEAYETTDIPDKVMPWLIKALPPRQQGNVGSCVSHGTARPLEYVNLVEISKGEKQEFKSLCREFIYGGSRVQIGGGKFKTDGSTGAWGSQFVNKYGTVAEEVYGKFDLRTYSVSRCKEWGSSGAPVQLLPEAEKHQILTITRVKTADEAVKALANGYFINICSMQGFTTRRNAEGICKASGTWAHSMSVIGLKKTKNSYLFAIENSWGVEAYTGPIVDLSNGACFWAEYETVNKMLGSGDSWAYSLYESFPVNKIDWLF